MKYDMIYDGQVLSWLGKGKFKATSGLPDWQTTDDTCVKNFGPIPEGHYKVFLSDHGTAEDNGKGDCQLSPSWGIQKIPRGVVAAGECEQYWASWGTNRARMEPADTATKNRCFPTMRSGFYLHDSTKGYSHGCIEVENRIFSLLRTYNKTSNKSKLILKVAYIKGQATNGGTKV